jgi:hypothetical protein
MCVLCACCVLSSDDLNLEFVVSFFFFFHALLSHYIFRLSIIKFIIGIGGKYISNNIQQIENDIDDDKYRKQVDQFVDEGGIQIFETIIDFFSIISIALHTCGIYGALQFKQWGIIVAGSTYALSILFGIISLDLGSVLMGALFLYPHIIMYKEMKEGIMTDYNYHKIAHCCGNRNM